MSGVDVVMVDSLRFVDMFMLLVSNVLLSMTDGCDAAKHTGNDAF